MKIMMLAAMLGISLSSNTTLYAQATAKLEEKADTRKEKDITPLRVQILLTEHDGEKKISSLPYTLLVNAVEDMSIQQARIRMGLRVPITTETAAAGAKFQYQDMGTNLDGWAHREHDGRFNLHLSVERSSAYSSNAGQKPAAAGSDVSSALPVIQQFRADLQLLIRDGQTIQATAATDPVSGRVTKIEVTANVMK